MHTTADLRREAVARTFFPQTDLSSAIARLGFVQADPSLEKPRALTPQRRADGLIHLLVSIYAPLPKSSLSQLVGMLGDRALPRVGLNDRIASLLRKGALRTGVVDGVTYVWDGDREARDARQARPDGPEPTVRFLAPFDPLVWDRRRFGYLWNWDYRFEAYTPPQKRRLGYYALPMLWEADGDAQVIGWVNVSTRMPVRPSSRAGAQARRVAVEPGYVGKRPRTAAFRHAMDAEVERLERFLVGAD